MLFVTFFGSWEVLGGSLTVSAFEDSDSSYQCIGIVVPHFDPVDSVGQISDHGGPRSTGVPITVSVLEGDVVAALERVQSPIPVLTVAFPLFVAFALSQTEGHRGQSVVVLAEEPAAVRLWQGEVLLQHWKSIL